MTMLRKKNKTTNVQLHIDKAYTIIDDWLPENYVLLVLAKLEKEEGIDKRTIRQVRNRVNVKKDHKMKVLNAIVEVALENKKDIENLKNLTA